MGVILGQLCQNAAYRLACGVVQKDDAFRIVLIQDVIDVFV